MSDPFESAPKKEQPSESAEKVKYTRDVYKAVRILDREVRELNLAFRATRRPGQQIPSQSDIAEYISKRTAVELDSIPIAAKNDLIGAIINDAHATLLLRLAQKQDEKYAVLSEHQKRLIRESVPSIPDRASQRYRGLREDGDPLEFLKKHYSVWLDARLMDRTALKMLDAPLFHALNNQYDSSTLKSIFASAGEARINRRVISEPVSHEQTKWEPREIQRAQWRDAKRQSRKDETGS